MQNQSIWELISKFTNAASATKKDDEQPKSVQEQEQPSDGTSYLKSYNPFAGVNAEKRQITSPRAERPAKTSIDLTQSKNLAGEKQSETSRNMVELINRHNKISSRLGKKKS